MPDTPTRPLTTPCPVKIRLADGSALEGIVWLLPDPSRPSGVTTVEATFDGTREFVAIGVDRGGSQLVARGAVRTIEMAADAAGASETSDAAASLDVVTLRLDSGEEVSGVLRAVAREGRSRMSDVFNELGRFIGLEVGDRLVLVAKQRVVRVSF